jgi:2-polyprenyl-3-methyl-5-hydroxy-6-metoxy-1,4-benzoquinol methylase
VGEAYDLIVMSEVLYYLESQNKVAAVVEKVQGWLRPGGHLIFGSAIDSVSSAWGLPCGAETAIGEFSKYLREVERRAVIGSSPHENTLIVKYPRDA